MQHTTPTTPHQEGTQPTHTRTAQPRHTPAEQIRTNKTTHNHKTEGTEEDNARREERKTKRKEHKTKGKEDRRTHRRGTQKGHKGGTREEKKTAGTVGGLAVSGGWCQAGKVDELRTRENHVKRPVFRGLIEFYIHKIGKSRVFRSSGNPMTIHPPPKSLIYRAHSFLLKNFILNFSPKIFWFCLRVHLSRRFTFCWVICV